MTLSNHEIAAFKKRLEDLKAQLTQAVRATTEDVKEDAAGRQRWVGDDFDGLAAAAILQPGAHRFLLLGMHAHAVNFLRLQLL